MLLLLSSTYVIRVVLSVSYLLVSYFVMNFLRRIFSVGHSFRSMCQSGRMKGFESVSKLRSRYLEYSEFRFAQVLFQDINDDKIDLTLFEAG